MERAVRTLLLAIAVLVMSLLSEAKQFQKTVYYKVGRDLPYKVIAADFNNDGNVDLGIGDWLSGHVSILLGNGDGTFQEALRFSVPSAIAIAAGDFDEDGNQDLAVVEYGGTGESAVAIFLGDGKGKFHQSATYPSGLETTSAAVADLNGDGHLDIAVTDRGEGQSGRVLVFFGTGHGKLRKPKVYKLSTTQPVFIAVDDLNGDRHPDLAVTQLTDGSVAVLMNDGTGKFSKPVSYNAGGGEVQEIAIADLNHDDAPDLVVANLSQGMVVLLNNGDGTFGKPAINRPCGNNCQAPEACVAADFNLDGNLDVACATSSKDSYFFYGNGKGKFGPAIPINNTIQNQGGFSIAAGDFNNDKAPDLAIPIEVKGKVAVLLNTK